MMPMFRVRWSGIFLAIAIRPSSSLGDLTASGRGAGAESRAGARAAPPLRAVDRRLVVFYLHHHR
jgi:hypothetical protein